MLKAVSEQTASWPERGCCVRSGRVWRERRVCKLLGVDRASYRYEPVPNRNAGLREELVKLARQKPRYSHRRLHAVLEHRGFRVDVKRIYWLYVEEGLAVRRRRRKRLAREGRTELRLARANQEWAMDFIVDALGAHSFRRSISTWLIENDENVKVTQELLRHASSGTTLDLYAKAAAPSKRRAHGRIVNQVVVAQQHISDPLNVQLGELEK